jgi:exodeoxyribonuclease VII small subunit
MEVTMAGKSKGLEKSLEQLNDILSNLEKEDISLEDSFALYQEGMKLLKQCNESIDKVEKQLMILEEEGESV